MSQTNTRSFIPNINRRSVEAITGIVGPLLCLAFDPIVFKGEFENGAVLSGAIYGAYRIFAYASIGLGIVTLLAYWSIAAAKTGILSGSIAGILLSGVVCAVATGLFILPFSLFGLVMCTGIFGFVPFVTATAYWRNGKEAFLRARSIIPDRRRLALSMAAGVILIIGIPALAQWIAWQNGIR